MTPTNTSSTQMFIDEATDIKAPEGTQVPAQPKLNKIEAKRAAAYQERRRRLINDGISPETVDQVIAQQDYDAMPPDKKIARLEKIVSSMFQSFQTQLVEMAQQCASLYQNQGDLADIMEVNGRAFSKLLKSCGVSEEVFTKVMAESQAEFEADMKAAQEARAAEKKRLEEQTQQKTIEDGVKASSEGSEIPEDATVFGG